MDARHRAAADRLRVHGPDTSIESWLNGTVENEQRGQVFGSSAAINYLAVGSGQFLLNVGAGGQQFSIAAAAISAPAAMANGPSLRPRRPPSGLSHGIDFSMPEHRAFFFDFRIVTWCGMLAYVAVMFTQYGLIVSHVYDRTEAHLRVAISAVLLMLFLLGGMIGPALASALMNSSARTGYFSSTRFPVSHSLWLRAAHWAFQRGRQICTPKHNKQRYKSHAECIKSKVSKASARSCISCKVLAIPRAVLKSKKRCRRNGTEEAASARHSLLSKLGSIFSGIAARVKQHFQDRTSAQGSGS